MPENKITIDELASMVQQGFNEVSDKFEGLSSKVDKRFDEVDHRLSALERGQEDIKLRQDNMAYRFELDELKKRVDRLEESYMIIRDGK
jgi:hypothetical protein